MGLRSDQKDWISLGELFRAHELKPKYAQSTRQLHVMSKIYTIHFCTHHRKAEEAAEGGSELSRKAKCDVDTKSRSRLARILGWASEASRVAGKGHTRPTVVQNQCSDQKPAAPYAPYSTGYQVPTPPTTRCSSNLLPHPWRRCPLNPESLRVWLPLIEPSESWKPGKSLQLAHPLAPPLSLLKVLKVAAFAASRQAEATPSWRSCGCCGGLPLGP